MTDHLTLLIAIFGAIATGLAAIATCLAAIATWRAPTAAAKLAESLRRDAEMQDERQRQKLSVFTSLMQERAQISSENSVRALNLIDVVFNESRDVREAWSELLLAFHMNPLVPHVIDERLRKLLGTIAKDVGLSDDLRNDDLGRVYYPNVMAQEQLIKDLQRQQHLASLQGQGAAGAAGPQNIAWPPKPE
jgi:hypothetical protein